MKSFSGTTNFATTAVWATKQVIGDTTTARRPLVTTTAGMPTPHIILPSIRGNAPQLSWVQASVLAHSVSIAGRIPKGQGTVDLGKWSAGARS